jgi:hypothetical protein
VRFTDHTFDVPLDHDEPDGERITVYAREVTADPALPWLLFLGGGPGFPAPRPLGNEGWLLRALKDYRVLSLRTATQIGGLRLWHTADHQHDGLRVSDGAVLSRLLELL